MPKHRDQNIIRSILRKDPLWSVYAIGDLAPQFFGNSEWIRPAHGDGALALLYRAFPTPVLFVIGEPESVAPMLDEVCVDSEVYLHLRPEIALLLDARYSAVERKPMVRMALDRRKYRSEPAPGVVRLGPKDLSDLQSLYADGNATGEAPDFFFPNMLEDGVFFGVREGGELVATAGTHLVVPAEGVAAVGNVYTKRDHRGRGLGTLTTRAVVNELLSMDIETIALNVSRKNETAIRIYEGLGFFRHCDYFEGVAKR